MRTIAELIRWRARRHPDLEAVWYSRKSQTYGKLNDSSSQLADALVSQLGIQPGDRVAILDKNRAAYLELIFACDKAGVVAVPINWRLTASEVKSIVEDIKPKLVVTGPEFKANGAAAGVRTLTFDEVPRGGDDPKRDLDGAVSTQFCTSGTTGLPKGAILTGWNMLNTGLCLAIEMPELRGGCRSLVAMPLFHLGGASFRAPGRYRMCHRAELAAGDSGSVVQVRPITTLDNEAPASAAPKMGCIGLRRQIRLGHQAEDGDRQLKRSAASPRVQMLAVAPQQSRPSILHCCVVLRFARAIVSLVAAS